MKVLFMAAALVLPTTAAADVPAGFMPQPVLAARASVIAGKPATVYCANDAASWDAEEATRSNGSGEILGHAAVGGDTIYLSPTACRPLVAKTLGRPVDLWTFGAAAEVLAHESEHLAGSIDEGATECLALAALPVWLRSSWRITNPAKLAKALRGGQLRHQAAVQFSPVYAGNC